LTGPWTPRQAGQRRTRGRRRLKTRARQREASCKIPSFCEDSSRAQSSFPTTIPAPDSERSPEVKKKTFGGKVGYVARVERPQPGAERPQPRPAIYQAGTYYISVDKAGRCNPNRPAKSRADGPGAGGGKNGKKNRRDDQGQGQIARDRQVRRRRVGRPPRDNLAHDLGACGPITSAPKRSGRSDAVYQRKATAVASSFGSTFCSCER